MTTALHEVCRASLPREALPVLAGLRARSGVEITLEGERAWVRWAEGDDEVLRRVLPISGVELYVRREGVWYRFGHHLPAFDASPEGEARPLAGVLFPTPVRPVPPGAPALRPGAIRLAPDKRPRPATAGIYPLAELTTWADTVPSARLGALQAAWDSGRVLLLGPRLPPLPGGQRYWGERVLIPLGYRPAPSLPESAVREALGAGAEELVLLNAAACGLAAEAEIIARAAFEPLTRAGLRLALREGGA